MFPLFLFLAYNCFKLVELIREEKREDMKSTVCGLKCGDLRINSGKVKEILQKILLYKYTVHPFNIRFYISCEFVLLKSCEEWLIPDDGLFDWVIQGHEELRVFSNATDKVPDKDVKTVGGGRLDPCWDPTVVCLDVGLQDMTFHGAGLTQGKALTGWTPDNLHFRDW